MREKVSKSGVQAKKKPTDNQSVQLVILHLCHLISQHLHIAMHYRLIYRKCSLKLDIFSQRHNPSKLGFYALLTENVRLTCTICLGIATPVLSLSMLDFISICGKSLSTNSTSKFSGNLSIPALFSIR